MISSIERAWLVLVLQDKPRSASGETPIDIIVPGVPDSSDVFGIDSHGLRRYFHERVTGGSRFQLPRPAPINLAIVTRDALAISNLEKTWREQAPTATELDRQIGDWLLGQYAQQLAELPADALSSTVTRRIDSLKQKSGHGDASSISGDFTKVQASVEEVLRALPGVRQGLRQVVDNGQLNSPLLCYDSTLHLHHQWMSDLSPIADQFNLLPQGDFESLPALRAAGWQLWERCAHRIRPQFLLSREKSRSGRSHIQLSASPEFRGPAPAILPAFPIWLQSPGIAVRKGDLLRIRGYLRIDDAITASTEGAMVWDTLGGPDLAFRAGHTDGWQQFSLIRAVPTSEEMHVILALTGLGRVEFDGLEVTRLRRLSDRLIHDDARPQTTH